MPAGKRGKAGRAISRMFTERCEVWWKRKDKRIITGFEWESNIGI